MRHHNTQELCFINVHVCNNNKNALKTVFCDMIYQQFDTVVKHKR